MFNNCETKIKNEIETIYGLSPIKQRKKIFINRINNTTVKTKIQIKQCEYSIGGFKANNIIVDGKQT